jgi:hypothetical protein
MRTLTSRGSTVISHIAKRSSEGSLGNGWNVDMSCQNRISVIYLWSRVLSAPSFPHLKKKERDRAYRTMSSCYGVCCPHAWTERSCSRKIAARLGEKEARLRRSLTEHAIMLESISRGCNRVHICRVHICGDHTCRCSVQVTLQIRNMDPDQVGYTLYI